MKFEFDLVPAIIGVCIYVFSQLLVRVLAPRAKNSKEAPPPAVDVPRRRTLTYLCVALAAALVLWAGLPEQQQTQQAEAPEAPGLPVAPAAPDVVQAASPKLDEPEILSFGPKLPPSEAEAASPKLDEPEILSFGPKLPPSEAEEDRDAGAVAFSVELTRQVIPGGGATAASSKRSRDEEDFVRSAYYGTLQIGSPALAMTVVFDTGSGHLVLPSMFCKSAACKAHTRYRRTASATARDVDTDGSTWEGGPRDSVTVSFGTGEITGVFVEDVICLSSVSNMSSAAAAKGRPECMYMNVVAATDLSEDPFKDFHFDGILGLGLGALSQTSRFNFMEVMAQSIKGYGGRNPHTFGVFLGESDLEASEISFGGWATKHLKEEISWGPIHDPEMGHWIVPIRGLRVNGERLSFCEDGRCRAAVDTGTSLLALPSAAFRELYERLRHAATPAGHCRGAGPLLHFELDHFTVTLAPRDYGQVRKTHKMLLQKKTFYKGEGGRRRTDLRCTPMLMTLDLEEPVGPKLFIMGEPVLRKYYTVYDGLKNRVGIARSRHVKAPSRGELLESAVEVDATARGRLPTMFDIFRWRSLLP